jgi:hypothetical protein
VRSLSRLACLLLLAALPCWARAAEDARSAADLIPADAGIVVQVSDLSGVLDRAKESRWYARLEAFRPWAQWREKNAQLLEGVFAAVAKELDLSTEELWHKVLGGRLTLVLWAPASPMSGDGARMLILQAKDAAALAKLVKGFQEAQARSGGIVWQERTHGGVTYLAGTPAKDGQPAADAKEAFFFAVWDETGVLTDTELALKSVLELHAAKAADENTPPQGSLAAQAAWQAAAAHVPKAAFVTVFVNPRAWDAALDLQAKALPEEKRIAHEALVRTWHAVEYGVFTVELTDRIAAQAVVEFDPDKLPRNVHEVVRAFAGKSGFFAKTPHDALIAAAGRIDVARLLATFAEQEKNNAPPDTGAAIARRMMSMVGPDMGTFLLRRPAEAMQHESAPALDWAIALGLRQEWTDDDARAVASTLKSLAPGTLTFAAKAIKGSPLNWLPALAGTRWDNLDWNTVELGDIFPIADADAFSVAGGFLWGGTSSDVIQSAAKLSHDQSLLGSPRFAGSLSPVVSDPSLAVYVDLAGLRAFLNDHADSLVAAVASSSDVPDDVARRGLSQLAALLQLGDTLVAAMKVDERGLIAASISLSVDGQ